MKSRFYRFVAGVLIMSFAGLGAPLPVHAGVISTDAAVAGVERGRVASFLERADVLAQLQARGVDAAQVKARVAALTDQEAAQLAAQLDALPAGGADVLGVILVVFLVLLLTDILGFTKIFPFTRSVR
jgi:hypothetical protein